VIRTRSCLAEGGFDNPDLRQTIKGLHYHPLAFNQRAYYGRS
jgi:hypothetical protein